MLGEWAEVSPQCNGDVVEDSSIKSERDGGALHKAYHGANMRSPSSLDLSYTRFLTWRLNGEDQVVPSLSRWHEVSDTKAHRLTGQSLGLEGSTLFPSSRFCPKGFSLVRFLMREFFKVPSLA
ncbi:hypothetical protein YC2023_117185 [Brassica napus]